MRIGRWMRRGLAGVGLALAVLVPTVNTAAGQANAAGLEWLKFPAKPPHRSTTARPCQ